MLGGDHHLSNCQLQVRINKGELVVELSLILITRNRWILILKEERLNGEREGKKRS